MKSAVDSRNKYGNTPLMEASWCGHTSTVQLLLERGADVNHQGYDKYTPLHYARIMEAPEELQLALLRAGADLRLRAANGQTAAQRGEKHKWLVSAAYILGRWRPEQHWMVRVHHPKLHAAVKTLLLARRRLDIPREVAIMIVEFIVS